ncbi:MAG: efflux RND transporter periplasmic adaptor subunit, partial [bacterium]
MQNRNIVLLLIILLLFSSTALAQNEQIVETAKSVRDDISIDELITGTLTPVQDIAIPAQTGGVADLVNVEIGDQVEKGAELIKIDDETMMIQKSQSEAALDSAEANYEELKNGATEEEMARIRANYEDAQASLESAETNL